MVQVGLFTGNINFFYLKSTAVLQCSFVCVFVCVCFALCFVSFFYLLIVWETYWLYSCKSTFVADAWILGYILRHTLTQGRGWHQLRISIIHIYHVKHVPCSETNLSLSWQLRVYIPQHKVNSSFLIFSCFDVYHERCWLQKWDKNGVPRFVFFLNRWSKY